MVEKLIQKDQEGRFMGIPVKTLVEGQLLWLINIYGPAGDHKEQEETETQKKQGANTKNTKKTGDKEHKERSTNHKKKNFWAETATRCMEKLRNNSGPTDMWIVGTDANAVMHVDKDTNGQIQNRRIKNGEQEHYRAPDGFKGGQ